MRNVKWICLLKKENVVHIRDNNVFKTISLSFPQPGLFLKARERKRKHDDSPVVE